MLIWWTCFRTTLFLFCVILLSGCRAERVSSKSMSGNAGPNREWGYMFQVNEFSDSSHQISPLLLWRNEMVIWRNDEGQYPVGLQWKDGRFGVIRYDTNTIEPYEGAPVLVYEGPSQPLYEVASTWDLSPKGVETFQEYVESLLSQYREDRPIDQR